MGRRGEIGMRKTSPYHRVTLSPHLFYKCNLEDSLDENTRN